MRHVLLRIGLLVLAALVVSVGVAAANGTRLSANSKVNKGDVRLCLNYKTGHVRAPKANRCTKNERFVTVRKATSGKTGAGLGGPQGPTGPQGSRPARRARPAHRAPRARRAIPALTASRASSRSHRTTRAPRVPSAAGSSRRRPARSSSATARAATTSRPRRARKAPSARRVRRATPAQLALRALKAPPVRRVRRATRAQRARPVRRVPRVRRATPARQALLARRVRRATPARQALLARRVRRAKGRHRRNGRAGSRRSGRPAGPRRLGRLDHDRLRLRPGLERHDEVVGRRRLRVALDGAPDLPRPVGTGLGHRANVGAAPPGAAPVRFGQAAAQAATARATSSLPNGMSRTGAAVRMKMRRTADGDRLGETARHSAAAAATAGAAAEVPTKLV